MVKLFSLLCIYIFASFAGIVRLFSRRFSHISCPKEITVWSFLPNIARSLLDFALAGDDASLGESGNLDRGSSSSSHFSQKLSDDDHAVRFD